MHDRRAAVPGLHPGPTLLDLVAAVGELTPSDGDVVAVVSRLLESGRVRVGRADERSEAAR